MSEERRGTRHEGQRLRPTRHLLVLRTSYFVLLATLVLGGCGFTTQSAATVGPERITMGELNAAVERLRGGFTAQYGPEAWEGVAAEGRRVALDNLVDERLLRLEARARGITVTDADVRARVEQDRATAASQGGGGNPVESFDQYLRTSYETGGAYHRDLRDQILDERLRPAYIRPVTSVALQQVVVDNQDRAREALTRGRAGTPIEELINQYAIPEARGDRALNAGNLVTDFAGPEVRRLFPSFDVGTYSEVRTAQGQAGQPLYVFYRVARLETRNPTPEDTSSLRAQFLDGLRAKYPVVENASLNLPPRQQ